MRPSPRAWLQREAPNAASPRWLAPASIDLPSHTPVEMPAALASNSVRSRFFGVTNRRHDPYRRFAPGNYRPVRWLSLIYDSPHRRKGGSRGPCRLSNSTLPGISDLGVLRHRDRVAISRLAAIDVLVSGALSVQFAVKKSSASLIVSAWTASRSIPSGSPHGASQDHAPHQGAGANKHKMARVLKEFQGRMRDHLGESLGGGGWRHDLVGTSGDDRDRDRDFAKALRCEDRPGPAPERKSRGHVRHDRTCRPRCSVAGNRDRNSGAPGSFGACRKMAVAVCRTRRPPVNGRTPRAVPDW